MEIINLGKADGLPPVQWDGIVDKLDAGSAPAPDGMNARTTWLATVNEDGSPHVTAVGAVWLDGTFWFQTGTGTRKGRNVARDQRGSVAVSIRDADVVFEGDATRVTDRAALTSITKAWADQGWRLDPVPVLSRPHPRRRSTGAADYASTSQGMNGTSGETSA